MSTEYTEIIERPPPAEKDPKRVTGWRRIIDSRLLWPLAMLFITLCALIASIGLVATNQERASRLAKQDTRIDQQALLIGNLQATLDCRALISVDFDLSRGRLVLSQGRLAEAFDQAVLNAQANGGKALPADVAGIDGNLADLHARETEFQGALDSRSAATKQCQSPAPTTTTTTVP